MMKKRKGVPGSSAEERSSRDQAIAAAAASKSHLVARALEIAVNICTKKGEVASWQVFTRMHAEGLTKAIEDSDPRWMGAVFNRRCWERVRWENTGRHKRPQSVWRFAA